MSQLLDQNLPNGTDEGWGRYKRRLFLAVGIILFLWLLANFVSTTMSILLLLFLCALIAIGIRGISNRLSKYTPLSDKFAFGLIVVAILILITGIILLVGPRLTSQFSDLGTTLEQSSHLLEEQLRQYTWGKQLLSQLPTTSQFEQQLLAGRADIFASVTGIVSSVLSLVSTTLIVIFVSLFFAAEPETYVNNFLRLFPVDRRNRLQSTLVVVNDTLGKWLLTRLISMGVVGMLTVFGLAVLDVPLALSLGIIAGIGAFIPTFGPILVLIPAVLVALIQSPQQVIYVLLLYIGVQMVDNYLITPYVQKSMLYLPPA